MQATVTWLNDMAFKGESESGHAVVMDSSASFGGNNQGARPMELILLGLGGCASIDVINILKKARQNVTDVQCKLTANRADAIPAVFTDIHLHFVVTGEGVKPSQIEKAIQLSAEKYCSASRMLEQGGVKITHDYELIDASSL